MRWVLVSATMLVASMSCSSGSSACDSSQSFPAGSDRGGSSTQLSTVPGLIGQQILGMVGEEDYEGALREAGILLQNRPDLDWWVATVRNHVVPLWAGELRRKREESRASDLLLFLASDNAAMTVSFQHELARPELSLARREALEWALRRIQPAQRQGLPTAMR